jgi:Mg-chelatase subunit ChlD
LPTLFQSGRGPALAPASGDGRSAGADKLTAGGQGAAFSEQGGRTRDLTELLEEVELDPHVHAMAQRVARQLSIRRRPNEGRAERGTGRLAGVPYRYRSNDIDLDKTIEMVVERPLPDDTDIIVREHMRSRRSVMLIVDVSGSMRGEKVKIAAATVAALSADLANDELALVAFWSDAALVKSLHQNIPSARLLDQLLRIPSRGLTNVHFGLEVSLNELMRSEASRRIAILLSDSVHNAGPDPREIAARFEELHVLLEVNGEHDAVLGRDMARLGGGRLLSARTHRDIAPALNKIFARR